MGRAIIITAVIAAATGTAVVLLPHQGHGAEVRAGAEAGEEHEGIRTIRGATCGIERWPVKTLSDPAARRVDFAVRPATVRYLGSLRANPGGQDSRAPLEMRVFGVQARLVGVKREPDSDYHLILSEGGATMIAEMAMMRSVRSERVMCTLGCLDQRLSASGGGQIGCHVRAGILPLPGRGGKSISR